MEMIYDLLAIIGLWFVITLIVLGGVAYIQHKRGKAS